MSRDSKFERRQFLLNSLKVGGSSIFANPATHLASMMLAGFVSKAQAETQAEGRPGKYLFIPLMGGPARWTFPPLWPHKDDFAMMIRNPTVGTKFTESGGRYTGTEYKTTTINGMEWPWLWQFKVGKADGTMRPMADLMGNMLMMRGIHTAPFHSRGEHLRWQPEDIPYTFGALVTDRSPASIPAVNIGVPFTGPATSYRHISTKGKASIDLNAKAGGNLVARLLGGLQTSPKKFHQLTKNSLKTLMKETTVELEKLAKDESAGFAVSSSSLKDAEDIIERGFGNLDTVFKGLLAKYESIVNRTVNQNLVGINDKPVGATSGRTLTNGYNYRDEVINQADIRDMIKKVNTSDPEQLSTNGSFQPGRIAANFAVAEFALLNGLSDNIAMGIDSYMNVNLKTLTPSGNTRTTDYISFDEHGNGRFSTLLANTFFNLCMGGCLLELIDQLKKANIFNDVLIDLSGEMGRTPREDQKGSDHGGPNLDVAMWSGALPQAPNVIGNVLDQTPGFFGISGYNNYGGSWGYGASNDGYGNFTLGHLAATQAAILRVPNPVRSAKPILVSEGGVLKPTLGMGRTKKARA